MAQLFPESFGLLLRLTLLGVLLLVVIAVFIWRAAMAYPAGMHEPLEQPVPFSHKHHVGDDGLDCRYCHASVEVSAMAGIPPVSTCMTCHSQLYTDQPALAPLLAAWRDATPLRWKRLHKLPDFVYFNHSIHIAKGVGCESCHGAVDEMPLTSRVQPLTMQWCLDCHRSPAQHLRPPEQIFAQHWHAKDPQSSGQRLLRAYEIDTRRLTDCSICHR